MIYVVSYDLAPIPSRRRQRKSPSEPNPKFFIEELEESRSWWHYLENTWLISTNESLAQLDERLRQHLRQTDKLLIIPFNGKYAGFLDNEAWDWIDERVARGDVYV